MSNNKFSLSMAIITSALIAASQFTAAEQGESQELEEVIVTAQKREQSLQDTPISIATLGAVQLEMQGIRGLDALGEGAIPSLRIQPYANAPSTLNIAIRGNGPLDVGQVTREGSVAIYLDGIYLGRAQGLGMEVVDLARIEVLRGPQGTLFGRNATGGAVNLISEKPTGEFNVKQTFGTGKYNEFRSATHVDFPEVAGIRIKFDYLHSERDGWVNNTDPSQSDYNAHDKDSGRLSLSWQVSDTFVIDYSYDKSDVEVTQNYFQLYEDNIFGLIGAELDRQSQTRFPVTLLEPTVTQQDIHALTLSWDLSDTLSFKSLSSYREMEEDTNNNYGGVFYFNGLAFLEDIEQDQVSQEFQLIGTMERFEWVTGLYYYKEDVKENTQMMFTLDSFGLISGIPNTPISPPTNVDLFTGMVVPPQIVNADAESAALYGQASWTPPILDDRLRMTLGVRFTEDEKSGNREQSIFFKKFTQDSENFDRSITFDYQWTENLLTYFKWGTAYKAGGASLRSTSFEPYGEEQAETYEVGIKSEFWNERTRLNVAIFATDYEDMQIDFADPIDITVIETINGEKTVEVDGVELDLTVTPVSGLLIGLHYTYLDGNMPLQPNPLAGGALEAFELTQTPKHAGSLTLDYAFVPWRFGNLTAHLDVTSTDQYAYIPVGFQRFDAYTLFNARLSLTNIQLGKGELGFSMWGKNLTDEEYIVYAAPVAMPPVTITQVFGTPRTIGFDITYEL